MHMTRLEKLERLYELASQATTEEQRSFTSCLWHRAAMDAKLRAAGLLYCHGTVRDNMAEFFGYPRSSRDTVYEWRVRGTLIWGTGMISSKRRAIRRLIRRERGWFRWLRPVATAFL